MSGSHNSSSSHGQLAGPREKIFFASVALFWFSLYLYIPFQTPYLRGIGISERIIGIIVGAYGVTQILLRLPIGLMADKIGRFKVIMMLGCFVTALSCLVRSLSPNAAGFLIGNLLAGTGAGMWIPFFVYYVSKFSGAEQQKATARIMTFMNGGMLAAFLTSLFTYSFLGMARMCLIGVATGLTGVVLTFFLQDSGSGASPLSVRELLSVCLDRQLIVFSCVSLIQQGIHMATTMSFTNQYIRECGASDALVGMSSVIYMVSAVVFAGLTSKGFCKRRGAKFWIPFVFLIFAVYCFLVPQIKSVPLLLCMQVLPGMGQGMLLPLSTAEAMAHVPPEKQSTAMGFYYAVFAIGLTVFPMFTGSLISSGGMKTGYGVLAVIAIAGAAEVIRYFYVRRNRS